MERKEQDLLREVFQIGVAQELLAMWEDRYCRKLFSSDTQRLVRNVAVSDFINDIKTVLRHG